MFLLLFAVPIFAGLASCVASVADSITLSDAGTAEASGPPALDGIAVGNLVLADPQVDCEEATVGEMFPALTDQAACVFTVTVSSAELGRLPVSSVDLYDSVGERVSVNNDATYGLDRTCPVATYDGPCEMVVVFRQAEPGWVTISYEGSSVSFSPSGEPIAAAV